MVKDYENIERNIYHLNSLITERNDHAKFLARNTKKMFDELKNNYESKVISEDELILFGKKIKQFFELFNQPISFDMYSEEIKYLEEKLTGSLS